MVVMTILTGINAFADDPELIDEMAFDPIHSTLNPSELHFEDFYSKDASITSVGDALLLKAKKEAIHTNSVILPVNGYKDYTIEFTFKVLKGNGLITISSVDYITSFGERFAFAETISQIASNPNINLTKSKFRLPKSDIKGQIQCKIVRSKDIVTFFVNGKFINELNIKPQIADLPIIIYNGPFGKFEYELESIRIDQGPDQSPDD